MLKFGINGSFDITLNIMINKKPVKLVKWLEFLVFQNNIFNFAEN